MAVARMTKIGIFGYLAEIDKVVNTLQDLGAVHVTPASQGKKPEEPDATRSIQLVERAVDILRAVHPDPPIKLKLDSISDFLQNYNWRTVVDRVAELKVQIDSTHRQAATIQRVIHELKPYLPLTFSSKDISELTRTKIRVGQVPVSQWPDLKQMLTEDFPLAELEIIDDKGTDIYFITFLHRDIEKAVDEVLQKHEYSPVDQHLLSDLPHVLYDGKKQELRDIDNILEKSQQELKKMAHEHLSKLIGVADILGIEAQQQQAMELADTSNRVFYITGWIKKKDLERVSKRIAEKYPISEIRAIEPDEGEEPPVALSNPGWMEPFEILTNMYGRPRMGMIDPTPWTGPFFAVFFAFCMTDAGYGLILTLFGSLALILKGKELPRTTKNFMKLILYVGVLTIIAGSIAGSYFGFNPSTVDNPGWLVSLMLKIKLFDALDDALLFFSISVIFGMIQIAIGFGLSAYVKVQEAKNRALMIKEFILGLSWILISLGLGIFIIYNLQPDLVASINPFALKAIFAGMIGIVLGSLVFGIAGGEGVGSALGGAIGFDGLYGITGLFGDILSYARILALGISTGVIAGVINSLGGMLAGGSIILGIVAAIFLVVGHIGYTALSALSAFIHPLRLQYVEYFGKFYEAGGNDFAPLEKKYENIEIEKTS